MLLTEIETRMIELYRVRSVSYCARGCCGEVIIILCCNICEMKIVSDWESLALITIPIIVLNI